jgi:DNA-binding transcriptional LysR family regulator
MDFDWDDVRLFLAVARAGQLRAAALALDLDVSTVSRRLDRLEARLGSAPFERSLSGTRLTPAGEALLPHAEQMERAAIALEGRAAMAETVVEGRVRLSVPPGVADAFVAPLLARFRQRHPRVVVELEASVRYADLTRREADLAVRTTRPTSGALKVVQLVRTRAVPMGSSTYVRELGKLKRLDDARWIDWGPELQHLPVPTWLRTHAPAAPRVFVTSHYPSQLAAAAAGMGLVIMPAPWLQVSSLVAVEPSRALAAAWAALPEERLFLVGHASQRDVPRIAALWRFLADELSHPERAAELRPG